MCVIIIVLKHHMFKERPNYRPIWRKDSWYSYFSYLKEGLNLEFNIVIFATKYFLMVQGKTADMLYWPEVLVQVNFFLWYLVTGWTSCALGDEHRPIHNSSNCHSKLQIAMISGAMPLHLSPWGIKSHVFVVSLAPLAFGTGKQ